jgi:ribose/xylose/arabinose/galactoside ABC-type transport system permease subunit
MNEKASGASGAKKVWNSIKSLDGILIFAVLVVYVALVSIFGPLVNSNSSGAGTFLTWSNIVMTVRQNAAYGIIACALTMVIITGNIDLSVGSMYTLCACVCAKNLQNGLLPAILSPLIVGALCGLVNGVLISRLKLNSFITTIATMSVVASIAILYTQSGILTPTNSSASVVTAFKFIGQGRLFGLFPMPIVIFFLVALISGFVLRRTTFGARLYYLGANQTSAKFSGINTERMLALTYVLSGLCCGLAALVTVSRNMSAQAQIGNGIQMDIILAVVLGGTSIIGGSGSIIGSVIGILFIGFLGNGFTFIGIDNSYTQNIISGIILMIALSFDILKERGVKLWKRKQAK